MGQRAALLARPTCGPQIAHACAHANVPEADEICIGDINDEYNFEDNGHHERAVASGLGISGTRTLREANRARVDVRIEDKEGNVIIDLIVGLPANVQSVKRMVHKMEGTPAWKHSLAVDNQILDNTCTLQELETGGGQPVRLTMLRSIGPFAISGSFCFNFHGRSDNTVRVWDLDRYMGSGPKYLTPAAMELKEHTASVVAMSVDWTVQHALIASPCLALWDLENEVCVKELPDHPQHEVLCVEMDWASKRVLSGAKDGTLCLWNLEKDECIQTLQVGSEVLSIAVDWTSLRVLCAVTSAPANSCGSYVLQLWDLSKGMSMQELTGHAGSVLCLAAHWISRAAISGSEDHSLRLWDLKEGRCTGELRGHSGAVHCVSVSFASRRALSGSLDRTLRLWDLESADCLQEFSGHTAGVMCVSVDWISKRAISGGLDHVLRLWNLTHGNCEESKEIRGHTAGVLACSVDWLQ